MDKINWIQNICGNRPNIEGELYALKNLKEVRNHLNHFDPPTFAVTLEEVSEWINHVLDVAVIICKIRKEIGVEISSDLVNLTLQRKVKFVPKNELVERRIMDKSKSGYKTSLWPETILPDSLEEYIRIDGKKLNLSEWVTFEEYAKTFEFDSTKELEDYINTGGIPKNKIIILKQLDNLRLIKK